MFVNNLPNYNVNLLNIDRSLHGGVPREFYDLKNKNFSDWEIPPWELFIFEDKVLGEGSFAKVYLAKWRGTFVVAKVINEKICKEEKDLVLREFEIMTKLHHPNIVQFLGYIDNPFIIVMEYIPNGDLLQSIEKKSLTKNQKKLITKDILQGLAYIHNRLPYSLIHSDIKPTNILLTNSKVAKITDFGLSKFYKLHKINSQENLQSMDNSNHKVLNKILLDNVELTADVGTERYMAPETLNSNKYSNAVDIYSCGILLYEMYENKRYIPNAKMSWYYTPKKIKNFIIENMLCVKPEERLEALELLSLYEQII